jgi:gluconolactonase
VSHPTIQTATATGEKHEPLQFEIVTDGLSFPEGPVFTSRNSVLITEVASGALTEVDLATGLHRLVADCGAGPNGAAIGPNGIIYVCNNGGIEWTPREGVLNPGLPAEDYHNGSIQTVDPETGAVTTLYDSCDGRALLAPNDLVFDAHGGFWFTDTGHTRERDMDLGGLFYALADGSSIREMARPIIQPNGVGLAPDGKKIYVAETGPGRLWQWDVTAPGVIDTSGKGPGGSTLLWGFDGRQGLDSLAIDAEGNVCVATLVTGAISVISPAGELLAQHILPGGDPFVTNICFGGDSGRDVFVTSGGKGILYRARWHCAGATLEYEL